LPLPLFNHSGAWAAGQPFAVVLRPDRLV